MPLQWNSGPVSELTPLTNRTQSDPSGDAHENFAPRTALALFLAGAGIATPCFAAQEAIALTTVPGDSVTFSNYYKQDVYNSQNNKIGARQGRALSKDGNVAAVIVGVGGFLGVGEKDVAVPFNTLALQEKNGDTYLVMNATKEALQSAPGYSYDRERGQWVPAKQPS